VLDPACGDGAFLLEVFDELCWRHQLIAGVNEATHDHPSSSARLALVRNHIFGVDIDPPAVEALRKALLERIAATGEHAVEARAVVEANIRHGDSLAGPDFARSAMSTLFNEQAANLAGAVPKPIDWRRDFPAAAAAGGFDIIIGNPPYVRERNAKQLFDALAATDLGRQWREARMDLWYYFVHRSLDLLRPDGILSFIVNSYWMSSRGAGKLIERLKHESAFEEIVLLENARIFKDIAGRHMIFRLRKGNGSSSAGESQPVRVSRQGADPGTFVDEYTVSHDELFQPGRLVVARPDPGQVIFENRSPLGAAYDTRQGMAENPPAINGRLHREFGQFPTGMGVFVLRSDEVDCLQLSAAERTLLRPYYDTKAVGRYRIANEPTHHVLYLSRKTAPSLDCLPKIAAHLEPFRPILERRREVQSGKIAWWHLHWPRDEQIFLRPRILCVQMGKRPQFVFAERATFVGFSINVILPPEQSDFGLDVLAGILNSDLAQTWFDRHAKRRGINLEINAHLLQQFPLPERNAEVEQTIGDLVRQRQTVSDNAPETAEIERTIELGVQRLYEK
jgi:SAM-dependent methyltransferase